MPGKPISSRSGGGSPAKRIPIESRIDVKFPNFEGFVTAVSANLSTSGMFVQTDRPVAAGTEFSFRFRIEDWSPIQGSAQVIWVRRQSDGPERPAGMGARFLDLDAQSRRMIRWLVDKHVQEGGEPFVLDSGQIAVAKPALTEKVTAGKRRLVFTAAIVIALAAAAFGLYRFGLDAERGVPLTPPRPAAADIGTGDAGSVSAASPEGAPTTTETTEAADMAAVTALIESWAAAWTSQRADLVLALYSADFQPQGSRSRGQWQTEIERRIRDSQYIRMAVSGLDVSFPAPDTASATFYRSLRSDKADETRRLILDLERTPGGWKIRRERVVR